MKVDIRLQKKYLSFSAISKIMLLRICQFGQTENPATWRQYLRFGADGLKYLFYPKCQTYQKYAGILLPAPSADNLQKLMDTYWAFSNYRGGLRKVLLEKIGGSK